VPDAKTKVFTPGIVVPDAKTKVFAPGIVVPDAKTKVFALVTTSGGDKWDGEG